MRNQSQRELLDEGLWSTMAGVTRGLRNATGSIASIALPKTTAALKKGASIASGAIDSEANGSVKFLNASDIPLAKPTDNCSLVSIPC